MSIRSLRFISRVELYLSVRRLTSGNVQADKTRNQFDRPEMA
jgi:hypothetical protein